MLKVPSKAVPLIVIWVPSPKSSSLQSRPSLRVMVRLPSPSLPNWKVVTTRVATRLLAAVSVSTLPDTLSMV